MPARGPRLDEQLCFALYAASNSIVRAYRPLLAELGLTYPQYLVMMVLWERDGVAVQQIAERLELPAHGVTPVLNRLSTAGWVERRPDPDDGRVVRVHLTEPGARLERDAGIAQAAVVCRTGLDPDALDALRAQLRDLARVTDATPAPAVEFSSRRQAS